MFSDAYKIKLVDDVVYEVYGKVLYILLIKYIASIFHTR